MARLKLTVVLTSGARIGPGKAKLLEGIRDSGSISAAAREMDMSYKRAWLLLDSINQAFEMPAVVAATSGQRGGGARLTDFGRELLERYRRMEDILGRLRHLTFFSPAECNTAIAVALERMNGREMRRLGVSRRQLFEAVERPAMQSLPEQDYEHAEWRLACVEIDYTPTP